MRIDPTRPTPETQETAAATKGQSLPESKLIHLANNALPPLEVGAELDAVVIDALGDGRLLLKAGDSLFEAGSPGGISAGQQLRLSVEQILPQVVLKITGLAPSLEAEATRLLRQLAANADAGGQLEQLQTLLRSRLATRGEDPENMAPVRKLAEAIGLMLGDRAPATAEKLQTLLQNGGLYYEAKLAHAVLNGSQALGEIADRDLKGLLLSALHESKSAAFGVEIVQAIHAQLNNVEGQQAGNLLAQLSNGSLQLQIPFFNGTNFTTATLSVEPDEKRGADPEHPQGGFNLLFLLDLENFGRTRIDAHIDKERLMVIFYVDRDSSVALANEGLPGFRELLLGMGYREVLLAARPLKEIPEEKQQKFDALTAGKAGVDQTTGSESLKMAPNPQDPQQVIALRYEPKKDGAPKIIGKGRGHVAERIVELAKQHNIPVRQDKNLVQILSRLDLNQEIPSEVFKAVAEILAFVYRLSNRAK